MEDKLSPDEDELYDRQIRVWGVDTQCAIRDTRCLVIVSSISTTSTLQLQQVVAAEVVKNIALAGIGYLHIHFVVNNSHDTDGGGNGDGAVNLSFLGQSVDEIKDTLSDMNPRTKVQVTKGEGYWYRSIGSDTKEPKFTVGLAFGKHLKTLSAIAEEVVETQNLTDVLFTASVRGGCGFAFLRRSGKISMSDAFRVPIQDLPRKMNKLYSLLRVVYKYELDHAVPPEVSNLEAILAIAEQEFAHFEKHQPQKDLFLTYLETSHEMPAVSAVIGGSLAQEVIKAISGKGVLMDNFYLFSAYGSKDSGEAKVELILPKTDQS